MVGVQYNDGITNTIMASVWCHGVGCGVDDGIGVGIGSGVVSGVLSIGVTVRCHRCGVADRCQYAYRPYVVR